MVSSPWQGPSPALRRQAADAEVRATPPHAASVATRIPIGTAAPLFEQAQRLLLQHWLRPVAEGFSPLSLEEERLPGPQRPEGLGYGGAPSSESTAVIGPTPRLRTIELKVSEFEPPTQLSFAELNRLDQAGGLRGMDPERLRALLQQERVLAARHGDDPFRHVVALDPQNVLAERRFRWEPGVRG